MGTLIARFPAAAAVVMDHCIQRSSTPSRHPKVSITYDFRLLDPGPKTNGERFFGLLKMVTHRQENLLMHALSRKLLETKWSVFGSYFYWFNFCMYVLFLAFLTSFILVQRSVVALPDPGSRNTTVENEKMFFENKGFNEIIPYIVAVFAVLHLAKEIVSIYMQRVRYFFLITNLLEWALYVMALIFMLPFLIPDTGLRSHPEAYWQMGTCAIFLGYLNFILFLRTFDYFGLYVTMFFEVFTTMVKAMIVFSLFLLAFSMVFYILFKEEVRFHLLSIDSPFLYKGRGDALRNNGRNIACNCPTDVRPHAAQLMIDKSFNQFRKIWPSVDWPFRLCVRRTSLYSS